MFSINYQRIGPENQFTLEDDSPRTDPSPTKGKNVGGKRYEACSRGFYLPTPRLFELAKRSDDRAGYCLGCSFLPQRKHQVLFFTLEWSGALPMGDKWRGFGPISFPSELSHLAVPINFFA